MEKLQTQIQTHSEKLSKLTQELHQAERRLKGFNDQRKVLQEKQCELEKTSRDLDDGLVDKEN